MEKTIRPIYQIAQDIQNAWVNVSPYDGAKPYLDAMKHINSITDYYYFDSAESIVRYFLSNAGSFRGPKARELKNELKELLKLA